MACQVRILQPSDQDKWDAYVNGSPYGTIFHRTGWRHALEAVFPYRSMYLAAYDGEKLCGCLPLFHVKSVIAGQALLSVPFGVGGGLCAESPEVVACLLEHVRALAHDLQVEYVELRHGHNHWHLDLPSKSDLYVNFERPIDPDVEANMAAIPRKQRRMIRQGSKYGFTSTLDGKEALPDFYRVYAHSVRNLGTPVFPYRYFVALMDAFPDEARILSVWHEGARVAGVLTFFFRDRVMPYYGGAYKAYYAHAVNDFMYWELMRIACERGYRRFDFGRSKRGTGPYEFKRHWGFAPVPLEYHYLLCRRKTIPNISPSNTKFQPFIALWKRLPQSVANAVGPWLIRYFP
ncbi:MAG: FemAB family PEP-CTERM system-associated protein [Nitrospirae bacterium]|nr:MAG: FemAB family PEP-CTERM system-associated protein [Nitrospirota bacterium]